MFHNKFDQLVRDRLLDHSSPFRADLWTDVRGNYGRRRAPRRWRWAAAGSASVIILLVVHHFVSRPVGASLKTRGALSAASTNVDRPSPAAARTANASHTADIARTTDAAAITAGTTTSGSIRNGHADPGAGTPDGAIRTAVRAGDTDTKAEKVSHRSVRRGHPGTEFDGATKDETGTTISGPTPSGPTPTGYTRTGSTNARPGARVILPPLIRLTSRQAITAHQPKHGLLPTSPAQSPKPPSDFNSMWHLDIYGSPDDPTTQFNLSYTLGVRLTLLFTKHIFATAGVQYSRLRPKRSDSSAGLYPAYFNNIDLPVLIGYTFGDKRFRGAVTAGAIVNLISHAVGDPGWGWPNRMGASAYLGFDMSWELSDRLAIFAEPYGRCMFTDHKSLFPSQTYTAGTLIGIRYNFMRR
jgi:hypothetical protein